MPLNSVIFSENYILTETKGQKVDDNLIPLFRTILNEDSSKITTFIYTKDLNPIRNEPEKIKEKARKIYNKLNREFAKCAVSYKIISSSYGFNINLHDRILLTNFMTVDCGLGFNLMPWKKSNSQIIFDTIFDKYTYKRMHGLKKDYNEYELHLRKIETLNFKYYPD